MQVGFWSSIIFFLCIIGHVPSAQLWQGILNPLPNSNRLGCKFKNILNFLFIKSVLHQMLCFRLTTFILALPPLPLDGPCLVSPLQTQMAHRYSTTTQHNTRYCCNIGVQFSLVGSLGLGSLLSIYALNTNVTEYLNIYFLPKTSMEC